MLVDGREIPSPAVVILEDHFEVFGNVEQDPLDDSMAKFEGQQVFVSGSGDSVGEVALDFAVFSGLSVETERYVNDHENGAWQEGVLAALHHLGLKAEDYGHLFNQNPHRSKQDAEG